VATWNEVGRFFDQPGGTMSRISCLAISFAVAFTSLVGNVGAQQNTSSDSEAAAVANQAIADLAAWRNKSARKYLQKQKAQFGSTPEFRTAWALLEIQEGADGKQAKVDRGVTNLSKMSKDKAIDAVASFYHGEVLYQQDKRKEANAAWQTAAKRAEALVEKNPADATAQFYLGAALVRTKEYQQARSALQKALNQGFDPAMVNHQIGLSYLFATSWAKAKEAFDQGLEIDPRYAPMYFWRAMAWEKLDRKDNLLIDLDQYVKLAPNGPMAGKAKSILKSAGR
jgi:tetratricopeptide (TPR) repeat protein